MTDSGVVEGRLGVSKDGLFVDTEFGNPTTESSTLGEVIGVKVGFNEVPLAVELMLAVKPAPVIEPEGDTSNWPEELGTSEALETPTEEFGTPKTSEGPLGETIVLKTPAEVLVTTTGELWSLGTLVVAF